MAKRKQGSSEPDATRATAASAENLDADKDFDVVDIEDDNPLGEMPQDAPLGNTPPSEFRIAQDEKKFLRQDTRPTCPMCGRLMHAVSTQKRQDGINTYYQCKVPECPEKSLLPVPRREFIDQLNGKVKDSREISKVDVSQGEGVGPVDGSKQIVRGRVEK
jgi:hypothetical protein